MLPDPPDDPAGFTQWLVLANEIGTANALREAEELIAKAEAAWQERIRYSASEQLPALEEYIRKLAETPMIKSGFERLDEMIGGGLHEGLYALGAIPSLGKSTIVAQIGDAVAEQGHPVFMFSLEMSRFELMARSISRLTCTLDKSPGKALAKSTRGILDGRRYSYYNVEESNLIAIAKEEYRRIADKRIYIYEGLDEINMLRINEVVDDFVQRTGRKPVVIVDYLQIIPPVPLGPGFQARNQKQETDANVHALKKLSRRHGIPVIVVSSFNRDAYRKQAGMESFKESGGIEYTADVLLGMQYINGIGEWNFDQAKRRTPREIELLILKNRNGEAFGSVQFKYWARLNIFVETGSTK